MNENLSKGNSTSFGLDLASPKQHLFVLFKRERGEQKKKKKKKKKQKKQKKKRRNASRVVTTTNWKRVVRPRTAKRARPVSATSNSLCKELAF